MAIDIKDVRKSIDIINKYIQENLYSLNSKTTDRWFEVKHAIDACEYNKHRDPSDPVAYQK